jgi:hypothetical protein
MNDRARVSLDRHATYISLPTSQELRADTGLVLANRHPDRAGPSNMKA